MCRLFENEPHLDIGWGCCRCHVYNRISRHQCKACGVSHCPVGLASSADILDTNEEPDEELGCPHDPPCRKCPPFGKNLCSQCGRDMALDTTLRFYLWRGKVIATTHAHSKCLLPAGSWARDTWSRRLLNWFRS